MSPSHRLVLFAKYLLTLDQPQPIEDAFVLIQGGRIIQVGRRKDLVFLPSVRILDLGDTVLLPGLINAHCHLDFTRFKRKVPFRGSFGQWLRAMGARTRQTRSSEFKTSAQDGIRQSLAFGTTTLCDIATSGESVQPLRQSGLRTFLFWEVLDLGHSSPKTYWKQTQEKFKIPHGEGHGTSLFRFGISPHTPFTVSKETLEMAGKYLSFHRGMSASLHLAESREEWFFYKTGKGPLAERIRTLNPDWNLPRDATPTQYINQCGWLPKLNLAVHVNHVDEKDLSLLAKNRITVVHCPGSNAFFRRALFPYRRMVRHRIPVCLGTDSLASNSSLSLFREMRLFQNKHPQVPSSEILAMVTTKPARALGLGSQLGRIKPGYLADLIGIPVPRRFPGRVPLEDLVLRHRGPVTFAMIQGEPRLRLTFS
jgi:cytosine/adenosine deaminase-related metal-dependent hydrolase